MLKRLLTYWEDLFSNKPLEVFLAEVKNYFDSEEIKEEALLLQHRISQLEDYRRKGIIDNNDYLDRQSELSSATFQIQKRISEFYLPVVYLNEFGNKSNSTYYGLEYHEVDDWQFIETLNIKNKIGLGFNSITNNPIYREDDVIVCKKTTLGSINEKQTVVVVTKDNNIFIKSIRKIGRAIELNPIVVINEKSFSIPLRDVLEIWVVESKIKSSRGHFYKTSFKSDDEYIHAFVEIPNLFILPIQQYLLFFDEYVKVAKGEKITFEITKNEFGIEITVLKNKKQNIGNIQRWLNEYFSLVKQDSSNLNVKIENEVDKNEIDIMLKELSFQVEHLKKSLENLSKKNSILEDEVKYLKKVSKSKISLSIDKPKNQVDLWDNIFNLIREGRILKAINLLLQFSNREFNEFNEILHLHSRINLLNIDSRQGIIDDKTKYLEINKITKSLIDLTKVIKEKTVANKG